MESDIEVGPDIYVRMDEGHFYMGNHDEFIAPHGMTVTDKEYEIYSKDDCVDWQRISKTLFTQLIKEI